MEAALSEEDARSEGGEPGPSPPSPNTSRSTGSSEEGAGSSHSSGLPGESSNRVSKIRLTAPGGCGQGIERGRRRGDEGAAGWSAIRHPSPNGKHFE